MSKNAAIAELLQASGLLGESTAVVDKSKRSSLSELVVSGSESQTIETEEKLIKTDEDISSKENSGSSAVPTLSIGMSVFVLNIRFS